MTIKHRTFQVTAIVSFAALVVFLFLSIESSQRDDRTLLYISLFLISCVVFYYSSKRYIAYQVRKRKAKRHGRYTKSQEIW